MDTRKGPSRQGKVRAPVAVTLGSVGGPGDLELFMENAAEWSGPKVSVSVQLTLDGVDVRAWNCGRKSPYVCHSISKN